MRIMRNVLTKHAAFLHGAAAGLVALCLQMPATAQVELLDLAALSVDGSEQVVFDGVFSTRHDPASDAGLRIKGDPLNDPSFTVMKLNGEDATFVSFSAPRLFGTRHGSEDLELDPADPPIETPFPMWEIEGALVGSGTVMVNALVALQEVPEEGAVWFMLPLESGVSYATLGFEQLRGGTVEECQQYVDQGNCEAYGACRAGPEPNCNPNPESAGILACKEAARCRFKKCFWAGRSETEECRCLHAQGFTICLGYVQEGTCGVAWAAEVISCLPSHWIPRR